MEQQTLLQSLQGTIEEWASGRDLSVSVLAADVAGGLVLNVTLLPEEAYRALYEQYADNLGYPAEALGTEVTLEGGHVVTVLGLDPIGETPQLIVRCEDSRFHLTKLVFDKAWAAGSGR